MSKILSIRALVAILVLGIAIPSPAHASADLQEAVAADPRPATPPDPDLAAARRFDCAQATADPPAMVTNEIQRMQPQAEHGAALTSWYGRQFVRSGVWTQAQADSFQAALPTRPEMQGDQAWFAATAPLLQQDMRDIVDASRASDYPRACRALMRMLERVGTVSQRYRAQWAVIDGIYAAEAARAGITLPH